MGDNTTERKKKIRKFKESAWKCVYYLSTEILALFVTYNEPWFMNTKYFWVGPDDQSWPDQQMKFIFLVWLETYMGDNAVPTAPFCSEKYNDIVAKAAEKGYRVSSDMPLVSTERISKIFAEEKAETESLEFHPLD